MSEPDQIPSNHPCRRCEHPFASHASMGECEVEFAQSAVPSLDFGSRCSCAGFVYEPAGEPPPPPEPGPLDGPAMLTEALRFVRLAHASSDRLFEREMMDRSLPYFAGAQAFAMAEIIIDNGTGDLAERRWRAALAGEAELPTTVRRIEEKQQP